LPQRPGGKTVARTCFGAKSGNIEQVHSTPGNLSMRAADYGQELPLIDIP
jgi:hypothetical protein